MLSYEQIVRISLDSSRITESNPVERSLEETLSVNLLKRKPVKVLTGLRRCGKSHILKKIYRRLLDAGIPQSNILFLNFEHDELSPSLTTTDLRAIYEQYKSRASAHPFFLFLDEVQNVTGWERFVRTLYDSSPDEIYITGSNSRLLSSEFSTALGGRILEYAVYPFSFPEYLSGRNFNYRDEFYLQENRLLFRRYFDEYIRCGGLPETAGFSTENLTAYRESLIEKIIIKDLMQHFQIRNPALLKTLLFWLGMNTGSLVNSTHLGSDAGVSDKTVETYLRCLESAFFIRRIQKYVWKSRRIFTAQKKFYFIDPLFIPDAHSSRRIENLVYLALLRRYGKEDIFFHRDKDGHEVDFLVRRGENSYAAIQVTAVLNDENQQREFRSLLHLIKNISGQEISQHTFEVLCLADERRHSKTPHPAIIVRPAERFLLG